MITKQMEEFISNIKLDKEYNWITDNNIPNLPSMENIISIDSLFGNPNYLLSNGTICTREEFNCNNDYFLNGDYDDEDDFLDYDDNDIIDDDYDEDNDPYVMGKILQNDFITTEDLIDICRPGHIKFVNRTFIINSNVNINKPILKFSNDGGSPGQPEIDRIMVDDNCYFKVEGNINFDIYVYLKNIPNNNIINILVEMSTCLD